MLYSIFSFFCRINKKKEKYYIIRDIEGKGEIRVSTYIATLDEKWRWSNSPVGRWRGWRVSDSPVGRKLEIAGRRRRGSPRTRGLLGVG
jgi:hypothetical protein